MNDLQKTLDDRGARYGAFENNAAISQNIKTAMASYPAGWANLEAFHREALEMIAHKIARILNGDPNYADSWHDIAGYAELTSPHNGLGRFVFTRSVTDEGADFVSKCITVRVGTIMKCEDY